MVLDLMRQPVNPPFFCNGKGHALRMRRVIIVYRIRTGEESLQLRLYGMKLTAANIDTYYPQKLPKRST